MTLALQSYGVFSSFVLFCMSTASEHLHHHWQVFVVLIDSQSARSSSLASFRCACRQPVSKFIIVGKLSLCLSTASQEVHHCWQALIFIPPKCLISAHLITTEGFHSLELGSCFQEHKKLKQFYADSSIQMTGPFSL